MRIVKPYRVREFERADGSCPFREWLDDLDTVTRARIQARIARLEQGNLGEYKVLRHGVHELKMTFGPGFRVYFGFDDNELVILLVGGDKSSQKRDIKQAQEFWAEFLGGKK